MNDGGPAFPRPRSVDGSGHYDVAIPAQEGMTLRDWFAGQVLANSVLAPYHNSGWNEYSVARNAYALADAMIKERDK